MAEKKYTIRIFERTVYEAVLLSSDQKYVGSSAQNCHSEAEAISSAMRELNRREDKLGTGDSVSVAVDKYVPETKGDI